MATDTELRRDRPASRRSRTRLGEDGRRLSTAGHALVVAVLALVDRLLLDAPGLHKSAFNQPPGVKRDVALAITGPLAGRQPCACCSTGRALVRTRSAAATTTRSTRVVVPPRPVAPRADRGAVVRRRGGPRRSRTGPPKVAFTPKRTLRLWVAGDSLVITPGYSIVRAVGASPVDPGVGGVDGTSAPDSSGPTCSTGSSRSATR